MIDVEKIRPGVKVRLKDGETGLVKGSYMAPEGIALTVKTGAPGIANRNVPLADVLEIVEEN